MIKKKYCYPVILLLIFACNGKNESIASQAKNDTVKSTEISTYENVQQLDSIVAPLRFFYTNTSKQVGFESIVAHRLKAKLIPNNERRKLLGITKITWLLGVTHFLLDHDLTTGFVHPYTTNFFGRLRPDDYVMKFDRSKQDSTVGYIYYVRKRQLTSNDTLGKNVAFFRQWKLSELDIRNNNGTLEVNIEPCSFAKVCGCAQTNEQSKNPFGNELLLWSVTNAYGYYPINKLNKLDNRNGGTVVIIWNANGNNETLFQDIHSSLSEVLNRAMTIRDVYHIDPTIAISDAGPFANKIKSNDLNELDCTKINELLNYPKVGAGFGYVPEQ
jgi:hypothetical protein